CYRAQPDRMDIDAQQARSWIELARLPNASKRLALILANYPTRDGRIGNGVGLDTPPNNKKILSAMQADGYPLAELPESGT
ncbi:cobaltochelatase subunit CobN, partial [Pseudomonas syringae group genomosp. 7]|uniref:cobaltochelatase subunit CobN n=1 Tax=Pseudomonas syringae group genomosp. 7 TaxID=251699 RepID=UPI0037704FFE